MGMGLLLLTQHQYLTVREHILSDITVRIMGHTPMTMYLQSM